MGIYKEQFDCLPEEFGEIIDSYCKKEDLYSRWGEYYDFIFFKSRQPSDINEETFESDFEEMSCRLYDIAMYKKSSKLKQELEESFSILMDSFDDGFVDSDSLDDFIHSLMNIAPHVRCGN